MTKEQAKQHSLNLAHLLSERKGKDIVVIDVANVTSLADYFIICSTDSFLHQRALAKYVNNRLDEKKIQTLQPKDNTSENPWLLIDCGFVVIHLFSGDARTFYQLEKLWADGQVIYESSDVTTQVVS